MAPDPAANQQMLTLPASIMGPADVARLKREVGEVDDFLRQAAIRKGGEAVSLPRLSSVLEEIAKMNNCNLLQEDDRKKLADYLTRVLDHAPRMHISFATEPSGAFMAKIVAWFRTNIHPETMVQVGLQPNIAAGCVLRTPNHQFDFSMRTGFANSRNVLVEKIHEVAGKA